jgi:hypothetical protein
MLVLQAARPTSFSNVGFSEMSGVGATTTKYCRLFLTFLSNAIDVAGNSMGYFSNEYLVAPVALRHRNSSKM